MVSRATLLLVPLLAISIGLLVKQYPEKILPLKIKVATDLLGWQGFMQLASANVLSRMGHLKKTKSREAWHSLLDALRDLDTEFLAPDRGIIEDNDIAEGHRMALHLFATAFEMYSAVKPSHPEFRRLVSPDRRWMGDNPDVLYYGANLNPSLSYRIVGRHKGEIYLGVTVYRSDRPGSFPNGTVSKIIYDELELEEDGSFVKQNGAYKNQLLLTADAFTLVTRHYHENIICAATDPAVTADIRLETVEQQPAPAPPTDDSMAEELIQIKDFISGNLLPQRPVEEIPKWWSLQPNVMGFPQPHQVRFGKQTGGLGADDIFYGAGPFKLKIDEALVIEHTIPTCRFMNVKLYNRFLQTFEYMHRSVSFNRNQLKGVTNNSYTLVVAHSNPGPGYNWLDTEGRAAGTVFWRIMMPQEDTVTAPEARVVKLADLK